MTAAFATIDKIIETKTKKPSASEAAELLRSCGVLDRRNRLKPAYRKLVVPKDEKK